MFASLVMASRGQGRAVWLGAAGAFALHVVIATTIGVGLFELLPRRVLDVIVAVLFLVGGIWTLRETPEDEAELIAKEARSHRRVVTTAFLVIFIAEWGDLTQILTANLAAHYHSPLSVGVGAVLALWAVTTLAVVGGRGLLRYLPVVAVRRVSAVVLFTFAAFAMWNVFR